MSKKKSSVPQVILNSQYLKDLSFENPHSPVSLTKVNQQPNIEFHIDINAVKLNDNNYEVTIIISAKANDKNDSEYTIFLAEIKYAGLFTITETNEERLKEIMLVYCPTLLFPYARRIISDVTRDGGFPPLMMDPINFHQLYLEKQKNAPKEDGTIN
mgnify:CR=1 FL=1